MRERLEAFLDAHYPGARRYREWPVALRTDDQRRMQGWIDLLLELPDGYVLIDHKSYPGADALRHAAQYLPQLNLYREAIETATGKPVVATLVHLPVAGVVGAVR